MLALAGHARLRKLLEAYLSVRGVRAGRCMLVLGFTGSGQATRLARATALAIVKRHGAVDAGAPLGAQWARSRFRSPLLRNTLGRVATARAMAAMFVPRPEMRTAKDVMPRPRR